MEPMKREQSAAARLAAAAEWARQQRGRSRPAATPVAETVDLVLARQGLARRVAQAAVVEEWAQLVGPQIAAVARAESVTPDGILRVRVATPTWATELRMMTPRILARVNANRKGRIREIHWMTRPEGS